MTLFRFSKKLLKALLETVKMGRIRVYNNKLINYKNKGKGKEQRSSTGAVFHKDLKTRTQSLVICTVNATALTNRAP